MKKRLLAVLLTSVMVLSLPAAVFADEESDLRAQREQAYAELSDTESEVDSLEGELREINNEIDDRNADLVDLLLQIEEAEAEIEKTQEEIEETQDKINLKRAEIRQTKSELKEAEKTRDKQYEDMKKRIQYIYENGGDIGWAVMILDSQDISSLFNKAEYATQLEKVDRDMLNTYINTVDAIAELQEELEDSRSSRKNWKS